MQSARARNKIRHWFSKERREAAAETGKTAIARMMRKQNLPLQRLATADALNAIATELHYTDLSALYAAVGEGHVSAQSVVAKLVKSAGGVEGAQEDLAEATLVTQGAAAGHAGRRLGRRGRGRQRRLGPAVQVLHPGAGDEITGFVTRGNGVSVHRGDCVNLGHLLRVRSPSGSSTSAGRRGKARSSWSRSRSRRSTAPACCPTSPGRSPTSTSTSCRRR